MGAWIGWLCFYVILVIVSWIVLLIILVLFQPEFYNIDGSVNWLTPLWVSVLLLGIIWILSWVFIELMLTCNI